MSEKGTIHAITRMRAMPKSCNQCQFYHPPKLRHNVAPRCKLELREITTMTSKERAEWCPLREWQSHGR